MSLGSALYKEDLVGWFFHPIETGQEGIIISNDDDMTRSI